MKFSKVLKLYNFCFNLSAPFSIHTSLVKANTFSILEDLSNLTSLPVWFFPFRSVRQLIDTQAEVCFDSGISQARPALSRLGESEIA